MKRAFNLAGVALVGGAFFALALTNLEAGHAAGSYLAIPLGLAGVAASIVSVFTEELTVSSTWKVAAVIAAGLGVLVILLGALNLFEYYAFTGGSVPPW